MSLRRPVVSVFTLLLAAAVIPKAGTAQEGEQATLYVQVDCMKSTSIDYADVETEIWQPMHQEMVNQGKKAGWAFYWVLYGDRSDCDYYTVNSYRGLEQLNDDTPFSDYFATVHPDKNWDEAMAKTGASREMVRSELWIRIDGVPAADHQFVVVNQMYAENGSDYVEFERETWKPIHQALVEGGHSAGWGLYGLTSPSGTSISYNFSTADFLTRLGPVPLVETIRSVHPDREVAAINQEGLDARDLILSETWMLIASTQ